MERINALKKLYELVDGKLSPKFDHSFDEELKRMGLFYSDEMSFKLPRTQKSGEGFQKQIEDELERLGFLKTHKGDQLEVTIINSNPVEVLVQKAQKDEPHYIKDPKVNHYEKIFNEEVKKAREEIKRQTLNSKSKEDKTQLIVEYHHAIIHLLQKANGWKGCFYKLIDELQGLGGKESNWLSFLTFEGSLMNFLSYYQSEYKNYIEEIYDIKKHTLPNINKNSSLREVNDSEQKDDFQDKISKPQIGISEQGSGEKRNGKGKGGFLKLPSITEWRKLNISYIDGETIYLTNGIQKCRLTARDIGWIKTQSKEGGFTLEWIYLVFCISKSRRIPDKLKKKETLKTIRCKVNKWFKAEFKLEQNPFLADNSVLFHIVDRPEKSRHAGQNKFRNSEGQETTKTYEEELTDMTRQNNDPLENSPEDVWIDRIDSGKPVNDE